MIVPPCRYTLLALCGFQQITPLVPTESSLVGAHPILHLGTRHVIGAETPVLSGTLLSIEATVAIIHRLAGTEHLSLVDAVISAVN